MRIKNSDELDKIQNRTQPQLLLYSDHSYRILIIAGSGSGQPDIDKIYLHFQDSYESKHQFLINKKEKTGTKHLKNPKSFLDSS